MSLNKTLWLTILMACLVPIVFAEVCEDTLSPGQNCTMITPVLSCSSYTYEIMNATNTVSIGDLTHLNNSIYYYTFSQGEGDYVVKLCDNSTGQIYVQEGETKMISVILGIGIVIAILFYFAFNIKEEHIILKVLFVMIGFACLLYIPNYLINGQTAGLTSFFKIVVWLPRLLVTYMLVYFLYVKFLKERLMQLGWLKGELK